MLMYVLWKFVGEWGIRMESEIINAVYCRKMNLDSNQFEKCKREIEKLPLPNGHLKDVFHERCAN